MSTGPQTPPPLAVAYLEDLDRALLGVDERERTETVEAVREHIAAALAESPSPTEGDVRAVLDRLGPVERIAASATTGGTTASSPPPGIGDASRNVDPPAGRTTGIVLVVLSVVSVLLAFVPWLGLPLALGTLIASLVLRRRAGQQRHLFVTSTTLSGVALVISAIFLVILIGGLLSFTTVTSDSEPPQPVETSQN